MKSKEEYIEKYGAKVVELARSYYETDSSKVLFLEDCKYDDDCPLLDVDKIETYLKRAQYNLLTKI